MALLNFPADEGAGFAKTTGSDAIAGKQRFYAIRFYFAYYSIRK